VDEVVGQKSFISNEDINRLSFTSMLIKETLRQYSTAPGILRQCRKETTVGGVRIPADSTLIVSCLSITLLYYLLLL